MKIFKLWIKRMICKHSFMFVRNIYGDDINYLGGKRSVWRCGECGKLKFKDRLYHIKMQ